MKKALVCLPFIFLIYGCDESKNETASGGADTAIKMFKAEMDKGDHPSFTYGSLVFKPDHQNTNKAVSGWVCGDGSMVRNENTYNFKVRGHVIKTNDISYVGDLAALLADTEMSKQDALYNTHCN
ncbi:MULTISPECIES: hypothetical protein [Enterobacter cloacae complex]|uniref:hypothetical protein n=1 Tax=Enterobacter cloacae complex TaxID=354276 RepID=UPI002876EDF3|nr:hypothetical protein [Enterobacter hormaechei]MDS0011249.1 hypothetical protein [Enterobacter hormaechei subsp. xiangfangensis]